MNEPADRDRPPMTATEQLARFSVLTRYEDLPSAVIHVVKRAILDGIACAVAGAAMPHSSAIRAYASATSPGRALVLGTGRRLSAEMAALVNASALHGIESDDYHTGALAHPGCTSVPVSLALAQEHASSGRDLMASVAVGMEVTLRLGRALMPSLLRDRGFHETGVTGVFGAAAGAASLLGADVGSAAHALAIAASHAAGTTEFTHSGGEVKRLHAGIAAAGGIRSVAMATSGLTGPLTVLEGPRGTLQAYADHFDAAPLTMDLGTWWDLLDTSIKPHACCGALLAPIALVEELLGAGLEADEVADLEVRLDSTSSRHVGAVGRHPADLIGAQMSAHYSLAMTLAGAGNSVGSYVQAAADGFDDPVVGRLAERIRVSSDAAADAARPDMMLATVVVTTAGGRRITRTGEAPGTPRRPLSREAFAHKIHDLLDPVYGPDGATAIEQAVAQLEHVSAADLQRHLTPAMATAS